VSDDALTAILALVATALLIVGNALFVFHEFAYVVIKPADVRRLQQRSGALGRLVEKVTHKLDHYIAVDQLGITVTSLAVGWIGQPVIADLLSSPIEAVGAPSGTATVLGFAIAFLAITAVQMIAGELMPKTVALRHPRKVARLVTFPVEIVAWIFHPLVWVLNGLGNLTVRLVGLRPGSDGHNTVMEAEELDVIIQVSARAGVLKANPDVLRRSLRFSDIQARDVLLPRQDVAAVSLTMTVDDVLETARKHRHTRYPVYDGTIDNIIGLVNVKDLIQVDDAGAPSMVARWQQTIRPIPALPEQARIELVLQQLSQEQQQMAVLIDEYGGTAGIVTVTDVAAELFAGSRDIRRAGPSRYLIAGDTSIDEVEATLDISLGDDERDYDTIAGYVMATLERVPEVGDEVADGVARLRVAAMRGRRITQIVVDLAERSRVDDDR
jgi:CBS domain containing-hemolysin-like protein